MTARYESTVKLNQQAALLMDDELLAGELEVTIEYGRAGRMSVYLTPEQVEELAVQLAGILEARR